MRQTSLMCGHLVACVWAPENGAGGEKDGPGGARLENLAHRAGASGLLDGAYGIAHGGRGERASEAGGGEGDSYRWRRLGWLISHYTPAPIWDPCARELTYSGKRRLPPFPCFFPFLTPTDDRRPSSPWTKTTTLSTSMSQRLAMRRPKALPLRRAPPSSPSQTSRRATPSTPLTSTRSSGSSSSAMSR